MKKNIRIKFPLLFSSIVFILLSTVSCSTSQNAYNDDGIYNSNNKSQEVVMVKDSKSEFYQSYFSAEGKKYDIQDDDILTDIDNYEGYSETDTVYIEEQYAEGAAPWDYASNVSISFNMGFGGYGGYGMYGGYWGSPWYGYGGYWGGYPWYGGGYWGYYPPYWGGYPPYWGGYPPYYPGYYPPYYGNSTYGKRTAYNTGRLSTRNVVNPRSTSYRGLASSSNRVSTKQQRYRTKNANFAKTRSAYRNSGTRSSTSSKKGSSSTIRNSNNSYNRSNSSIRRSSPRTRSGSSSVRKSSNRHQVNYNNKTVNPRVRYIQSSRRIAVKNKNTKRGVAYATPSRKPLSSRYSSSSKNSYSRSNNKSYSGGGNKSYSNNRFSRSSSYGGSRSSGSNGRSSSYRSSRR